ncbi:MAG: F0F1 ATP synthase subunit delta [Thiofilum sp.]|uniref:F0F1 ATP synthase subunit delta n=1 Tax=Thiofilum sp. TaxID=2212733 RepID=UPI0025ECA621|nr:F0F1 ATP synthase subunit delta [Thiofilum sp.]MBK8452919.1 F0F1 ATP synthase subunit delta [Thiofilum sp.]
MSELTTAARPYAKAVFEMAQESGNLAGWSEQLAALAQVISTEDSAALLNNPRLSQDQKIQVLTEVLGSTVKDDGSNLLKVLGENNRFVLVPEISRLYEELKAQAEGAIEAELTSAMELTADQQNAIAAALQKRLGREVKLVAKVDPSLMAGAVVRAGDLVIDGSIQSRLNELKAALSR